MSGIIPIPTTRVGDLFVRRRLAGQVQQDQLALFRLQNQISTGQRLQLPSDDAPAALRAINLQRLLDRKGQIHTNLQASNQYLGGADARLASVATALTELRGTVVSVSGTVVSDAARQAVIQDVDSLLQELVNAGNAKMQGRYLFAGSRSQTQPYGFNGQFVEYLGNEGVLRNFVDLERLFETNISGTEVFGGLSSSVQGSVDLDPHVTADTLVSTINGGSGVGRNPAITLSVNKLDGTTVKTVVDLSKAVTLGDVAQLIEAGAPAGTSVTAEVTDAGLVLSTTSGTISVAEVAEGRTARLLGILSNPSAAPSNTITGADLNPALLKTTPLANLFGGSGDVLDTTSGLILTNGGKSVTLDVSGAETVEDLLNLINREELGLVAQINAAANGINIRSRLSGADFTIGENGGTTATQLGIRTYTEDTKLAAFNRGVGVPTAADPTRDDLLIKARDLAEFSINLSGAATVNDVIARINSAAVAAGVSVTAQLATTGNGIEIVDASAGAGTLTVQTVEGSNAAQYLGFVADGQTQSDPTDVETVGATQILASEDRHTLETDSVFNTLFRLRSALETGNVEEIGRSLARLDDDMNRVNFARAEIGGRLQNLEAIELRLQDENVQLRSALSQDMDVDLVEAISNLTARQFAFEASLRSAGSLMQLSLLNFI